MSKLAQEIMSILSGLGDNHSSGIREITGGYEAWINYHADAQMGGNWSSFGASEIQAASALRHKIQEWLDSQV